MTETIYYPAQPAPLPTPITEDYEPGDTTVHVESTTNFPSPTNRVTIYDQNGHLVTLGYTGKTSTTFTGISYVEGDNSATFTVGEAYALRTINAEDINSLQNGKLNVYIGTQHHGKILKVGANGEVYPDTGGSGTVDYNELTNKPQINSVTLSGNKTLTELGIASIASLNTKLTIREGDIEIGDDANGTYIWVN